MIYTHTNNGRSWLIVQVPEGYKNLNIRSGVLCMLPESAGFGSPVSSRGWAMELPDGTYGTPVLAKDIGNYMPYVDSVFIGGCHYFANYLNEDYSFKMDATGSFYSLIDSHNLTPETAVIIEVLN